MSVKKTYLLTQADGTELHVIDGRIVMVDKREVLADVASWIGGEENNKEKEQ